MTRTDPVFGAAITALITPFRDGRIDAPALAALVARQIAAGTTALVACGSTGEAAALSGEEHAAVIGLVVAASARRVPVLAGCTASSTVVAIALAGSAAAQGADGLLLAAPPYVKPTQDGIAAHVRAVAHAADLPVMLYDIPARTGVAIADATIARLFNGGLIVALKDATADLARPARLHATCGAGLAQYSGDDATTAAYRASGGAGCVSVTANIAPALCAALHSAWASGDMANFTRLRALLDPLHRALFTESNPIPVKAALAALGLCRDELRLPLLRAGETCRDALRDALALVMADEIRAQTPPRLAPTRLAWAS